MGLYLQDVLDHVEKLVSLPAACIRINELIDDPTTSMDEIARVINQDVALTARLLRLANSPAYGFPAQVDTVARALTILGTEQLRDLALATVAIKTFEGIPNNLLSMESFWQHSIYCALCARELATLCLKRQRDSLFVAGLLHDIGQLVLFHQLPGLSCQVLQACIDAPGEPEIQQAEKDIIGFDHTEVGNELALRWSLPASIRECIACHHDPQAARQFPQEAAIVHIANSLATLAELNDNDLTHAPAIQPGAWQLTELNENIIDAVISSVKTQFANTRALLTGNLL